MPTLQRKAGDEIQTRHGADGTLNQWSVADVDGDPQQCGLSGSPTKVKAVQNIVFQAKECKRLSAADADIEGMVKELLSEKIIG